MLLACFPNVAVNLEGTSLYVINMPRKFAEILGTLLAAGAADRIIWGTGGPVGHPRPLIEAFWNFEMPVDLVEGYGYPPLTEDVKRAILGENVVRILGIDLDEMRQRAARDEFADRGELAEPWSAPELKV